MRKHFSIAIPSVLLLQLISFSDVANAQAPTPESRKNQESTGAATGTSADTSAGTTAVADKNRVLELNPISKGPTREVNSAQDAKSAQENIDGVPLRVGGEEILRFKTTISGFTPEQRVAAINQRIAELIKRPDFDPQSIQLPDTGYSTDLVCGNSIILTVTDRDANLLGFKNRQTLAEDCSTKLSRALIAEKASHSPKVILIALGSTTLSTVVLLVLLFLLAKLFPKIYEQIDHLRGRYIRALRIQKAELLSEESLTDVVIGICRIIRGAITVAILLVFFERVLSFFPSTRKLSTEIVESTLMPMLGAISGAICSYLPNLVFIALILTSSYYLITFTNFIFREIGRGKITVSDFDPEWADPTYKIARFLIVAFSLVLIFPYLPGSGSPAFQQISLFLGVLISLGSSGAVSNIVAGVFLTYTGAFRLGDRVKISDTVGDVVERKLLYTRVRTIKDEYITIPNSMVLSAHIINYSSSMRRSGLILHTAVTIGYGVEWRVVEKLLLAAATATNGVLADPAPFVLVTTLDNSYVTHEINCYTASPHMMAVIYADLHKAILDQFAEAGVEIMSPSYYAIRKGDHSTVPARVDASKS